MVNKCDLNNLLLNEEIRFCQENGKEFQLDVEFSSFIENLNLVHVKQATLKLEQLRVAKQKSDCSDPQIKRIDELLKKLWSIHMNLTEQAEKLFLVGYAVYQKGDYQSASNKFDEVIQLNSKHVSAHYYKASCLQNLSLFQDAIGFYNLTLKLDPKHSGALQQRGNCYRGLGQLSQGLKDLDLSIQMDPDILYNYYIRSLIHFSLGNYKQANADFIKAKPYMPTNQYFLAHEKKLQQVFQAEQVFQQAIQCQSSYLKMGLFNQAISICPDHAMAHYHRGAVFYQQSRFTDAITAYTQAININPEFYGAISQRGECYRANGDLQNALIDLNKALSLEPDYAYGYYLRSLVHYASGTIIHALIDMEFAKPAVNLDPNNIYYRQHQTKLKNYFGSSYHDYTNKIVIARQSYSKEKISLGLGMNAGESIEGCSGNTDKEIAKGGPAHVCKILKTDSDVCAVAKSEWNDAFKSATGESSYSGFSAGIDSFGMASRLETATSNLNKHCRRERESFARNRAEYSTGGRFSFRDACDRMKHDKK